MRLIPLTLALVVLAACSRESGFLEKVPEPPVPQRPQTTPPPVPTPTPTPPPGARVYNKTLEFKIASQTSNIPAVDILWVIDNSGTMANEHDSVVRNTARFLDLFQQQSQLRWRMGMISTDVNQDPYIGFRTDNRVDPTTSNNVQRFQEAVMRLGVQGNPREETFRPVLKALRENPDFLNPDAYLAIIVVTDEEEGGNEGPVAGSPSPASFVNQLAALKGGNVNKLVGYGVFMTTADCPIDPGFSFTFGRYWDFMRRIQSKRYPLCHPNFGQLMANLGEDLITHVSTLDPIILLDARPIPSTIRLTYKGRVLRAGFKEEGGEWIYDPVYNFIRVTNPAILDSAVRQIRVEFTIDPSSY
ncbi:MAG TPA: vWA domain-containing protein [Bdellovibrionales bacterium]|nr:vWA domain-containing protein [Bdellovibrionales bacterium]